MGPSLAQILKSHTALLVLTAVSALLIFFLIGQTVGTLAEIEIQNSYLYQRNLQMEHILEEH